MYRSGLPGLVHRLVVRGKQFYPELPGASSANPPGTIPAKLN